MRVLHLFLLVIGITVFCSFYFGFMLNSSLEIYNSDAPSHFFRDNVEPTSSSMCNSVKDCKKQGYDLSQHFLPTKRNTPLEDSYITLWLHQVHTWFKPVDGLDSKQLIRNFLQTAKDSGFTAVMGDLPYEWTERDVHGEIQLDSFGKNWMADACEIGLKLHIVLTMRHPPVWMQQIATDDFFDQAKSLERGIEKSDQPAAANPRVWDFFLNYTKSASTLLLEKHGECIETISPTMNNELETRYVQTGDAMRDYSPNSVQRYKQWQVDKGMVSSIENSVEPPVFTHGSICTPISDEKQWWWLGFREEFLATRYEEMCKAVHESSVWNQNRELTAQCLLHFGEMFASTDHLHTNAFFKLAQSPYIDHLVMDSNMALVGAPSTPSIVGILVSTAQLYGKKIHYEAATERILHCDSDGHALSSFLDNWREGGPLLLKKGILGALDAGIHSLGITNLCAPQFAGKLFSNLAADQSVASNIQTALPFQPTALIFVPYRAFYAWKFIISDITCGANPIHCWHHSFSNMDVFGTATLRTNKDMCPVDIAQNSLVHLWDVLRVKNSQIAVVGDPVMLTKDLLKKTVSRYILTFPCLMEGEHWAFYEGEKVQNQFKAHTKDYAFEEYLISGLAPEKCSL